MVKQNHLSLIYKDFLFYCQRERSWLFAIQYSTFLTKSQYEWQLESTFPKKRNVMINDCHLGGRVDPIDKEFEWVENNVHGHLLIWNIYFWLALSTRMCKKERNRKDYINVLLGQICENIYSKSFAMCSLSAVLSSPFFVSIFSKARASRSRPISLYLLMMTCNFSSLI